MSTRAIVPVKLSLYSGDVYTLWAPTWTEHGTDWQAFLGDSEHILAFHSVEELLLYIETNERHDLTSHPEWKSFNQRPAHRVVPGKKDYYDIVGVPEALAGRASYENVSTTSGVFEIAAALANVGAAEDASIFFSSHSVLRNVHRGAEHYSGPEGPKEWTAVGRAVVDNWEKVCESLDEAVRIVETDFSDERIADAAGRISNASAEAEAARKEAEERRRAEAEQADPYDNSLWATAGIDPVKVIIQGKAVYTLRTYLDGNPVFLGRFGEIFAFPTAKQMLRWIMEHDEHDLARMSTWEEISTAATGGELEVTVHDDNVYSFQGIADDILKGPDAVDTQQMNRAYEVMADAADWAGDDSLNSFLLANPRFQDYLSYMLGATDSSGYVPSKPYDDKAQSWRELEDILIKRFSKF
ncbi:hypothetical protein C3B44_02445 [Corynebacterium yudongzhengii]|uniref:Primosomal protein n=1 Tax=Corynebacterium yudongzhengii TaxID=2080740 RepID=A0A2U1T734_9CORY|nr:hypothetical protein [Corynebacterium yudongzhengii]AWB81350.1 hypothetical protein C3B44_02445 [Corynebacterium yudongzhengii]PWC01793.1 hypothetical protein DF222_05530 [Corynebacterium yudongzhengii]